MTERERLIFFLKNANAAYKKDIPCSIEEFVADFILAHGVIIPPCDIGDEIYCVVGKDKIYKSVCCGFTRGAFNNLIITDEFGGCHTEERVFLTYEEAKAALKEREQNGSD